MASLGAPASVFEQSTDSMMGAEPSQKIECVIKLMLVGNSGVGKTCLLLRFANNKFQGSFASTVGIDFKVKAMVRGDRLIKLQIWDTAGQEKYRSITTAYYRTAMGFVLLYDITDEKSFKAVQEWSTAIKAYSWENAKVILIGNKNDLEEDRQVTTTRGKELADQMNYLFVETSAKDGTGVEEAFTMIVDAICDNMAETLSKDRPKTGTFVRTNIKLKQPSDEDEKKCCC